MIHRLSRSHRRRSVVLVASVAGFLPETDDWVVRVIANGGAQPSDVTIDAVDGWYREVIAHSMWGGLSSPLSGQLICANLFAPDSLAACLTPQIAGIGNDPWVNHNFVSGDLTVNGLIGNGTNKYLDPGVSPDELGTTVQGHLALYCYDGNNDTVADIGVADGSGNGWDLYVSYGGDAYYDCWDTSTGRVGPLANSAFQGFIIGDRVSDLDSQICIGNSGTAFQSLGSIAVASGTPTSHNAFIFAENGAGTPGAYSGRRFSFASLGFGMGALREPLCNATQAARVVMGGGWR